MVLFTLGTGVGGGIIIGDMVIEGEHSHGGELGHIKIEMTNPASAVAAAGAAWKPMPGATAVVKRKKTRPFRGLAFSIAASGVMQPGGGLDFARPFAIRSRRAIIARSGTRPPITSASAR